MYNKSKNKLLFVIFIFVVLLIISILVLSVYNTRQTNVVEEYKISPNNVIYDEDYSYVPLKDTATLKKEWDKQYYLYSNNNKDKYFLGTEPVFYDKSTGQVIIYGTVYQVYSNGDVSEQSDKTIISNLDDFQFFKLNDRKYLIIAKEIKNESISTSKYLIVSIDRAGNASFVNANTNIKTINPLILTMGNVKFDIANEKLINGSQEIDLKKINGSTNEYVADSGDKNNTSNGSTGNGGSGNGSSNNGGGTTNNGSSVNITNEILNNIITLGGFLSNPNNTNKGNLYKSVSLRTVSPGATFITLTYSIVDPEEKYTSVYLTLEGNDKVETYSLSKEGNSFKISGLNIDTQYILKLCYTVQGSSEVVVADTVTVLTSSSPADVKITQVDRSNNTISYNVKMYEEDTYKEGILVKITDCESEELGSQDLILNSAISAGGQSGTFEIGSSVSEYVCLQLYDENGIIYPKSYHKIKY